MSVQQIFLQHPAFIFHNHQLTRPFEAERGAQDAKALNRPLTRSGQAAANKKIKRAVMMIVTATAIAWILI